MRKINIISRKYDGSLRDEHEAFVYAEDEECLVVYAPPGTPEYDHRKQDWSAAPDGILELYFKSKWYTVLLICEQNSCINQSYTHISMPTVATASGIEWVDLDLDYRVHLDGRIERLDEDEYAERSVIMGYPPAVRAEVRAACAEVEALYAARVYPYNFDEQLALYARIKAGQA
jgi:protein associated with RNAse G/E